MPQEALLVDTDSALRQINAICWALLSPERCSMKIKQIALLPLLFVASISGAAQFESVIDAMAIKSSAGHTSNGWEDISKLKM